MRWGCADSIRARGNMMPHPKAGYMDAIFFLPRTNFLLASRGEPYMTLSVLFRETKKKEPSPPRPKPMAKHVRASLFRDSNATMRPSYDDLFGWLAQEVQLRNADGKKPIPCV
jgi:hypothetical protein